jgi:hypothetical protein
MTTAMRVGPRDDSSRVCWSVLAADVLTRRRQRPAGPATGKLITPMSVAYRSGEPSHSIECAPLCHRSTRAR